MSRIVIPGGSGFLGQALASRLVGRGDEVVILSRDEGQQVEGTRTVAWDAESIGPWESELDGADAIVHLTGRRVDVRGTKRNIDELISSRVQPVRVVGEATMTGTYHVTSPNPVTNAEMMSTYRRLLGRRIGLPSPAWLARIGAPILGSSASLALTGRRVVPTRLLERGFTFEQPDFESAARKALGACGLL